MNAPSQPNSTRALVNATLLGTVMQIVMVVAGHLSVGIAQLFAPLGMTISLVAGFLYARWAKRSSKGASAVGGAIAGGLCALLGIAVSYLLGDVPAMVLAFGTASSALTGAIGGLLGHLVAARSTARQM